MELGFTSVIVVAAVAAVVELVRRAFARDWEGAVIIVASMGVGALAGIAGIDNLTWFTGAIVGAGASGLITIVSKVGSNTSPRVTD